MTSSSEIPWGDVHIENMTTFPKTLPWKWLSSIIQVEDSEANAATLGISPAWGMITMLYLRRSVFVRSGFQDKIEPLWINRIERRTLFLGRWTPRHGS
jgi:hypothetical protein